jgi:hypothetical protein
LLNYLIMAKNTTVSKFPYRHIDKNKRHQVGLKLRIIVPKIQLDFKVLQPNGEDLKLTTNQYQNLTPEYFNLIENQRQLILTAAKELLNRDIVIVRETIEGRILQIKRKQFADSISGYVGYDIFSDDELEELDEIVERLDNDEPMLLEDLASVIADVKLELDAEKEEKRVLSANKIKNTLERTRQQYILKHDWDRTNLILQVGHLFTLEKDNGKPLIHALNRGLLNNLYDFILNQNRTNNILSFTDEFCSDFVKYMVNTGVIKASLGKTPMELVSGDYDYFFTGQSHSIISYSTLIDKIKALNSIINNLKEKHIPIQVNRKFKAMDFIDTNVVITEKGSNKDHHLKPDEVQILLDNEMESAELELTKDVFLILIFCGGLRGVNNFDVEIDKESGILDVLHSKVNKRVKIPVFPEMGTILDKYDYQFPNIPNEKVIAFNLRAIAKKLNWDRIIKTDNTSVKKTRSDDYYFKNPIHEIIDQTFARKTFVNYARRVYKMKDGEIIQYTGHASVDMLKHYMGDYSVEEMKKQFKNKRN